MSVVGYGSTKPISRDPAPPASTWDGSRCFRTSAFEKAVNDYWGTWRLPSQVCAGDSGAPTFVDDARDRRARRLVAVVSDGGKDCASTDARVRVDTAAMQEWIARVIREEVENRPRPRAMKQGGKGGRGWMGGMSAAGRHGGCRARRHVSLPSHAGRVAVRRSRKSATACTSLDGWNTSLRSASRRSRNP
jgi:hypothetical protein